MAFLDINPASVGHTLVVPRVHADDLMAARAGRAAAVMRGARAVALLLDRQLDNDGITLFRPTGRPGGRTCSTCACMSYRAGRRSTAWSGP